MIHSFIGLISFAVIFGGALIGLFVRRRLPGHHLSSETQSAITVSVAVIGTLSALVLGLMISAANSSFSKASDELRELSLQLIRMDRNRGAMDQKPLRHAQRCTPGQSPRCNSFSRRRENPLYQVKQLFKCSR